MRTPVRHRAPPISASEDHGLLRVPSRLWNGFSVVCLADAPPDFAGVPDLGRAALDNWPMATSSPATAGQASSPATGRSSGRTTTSACTARASIPELTDLRAGLLARASCRRTKRPTGRPSAAQPDRLQTRRPQLDDERPALRAEFPGLTEAERPRATPSSRSGPTIFVVRPCRLRPRRLARAARPRTAPSSDAEWLFPPETLAAARLRPRNVADFATTVLIQDAAACEMNQRGLRSTRIRPRHADAAGIRHPPLPPLGPGPHGRTEQGEPR